MALSPAQWEKARTLFESGESLAEIQKETGIPRGSVGKKAAKDGWVKGKMRQLQNEEVQATVDLMAVEKEKATLNATERACCPK